MPRGEPQTAQRDSNGQLLSTSTLLVVLLVVLAVYLFLQSAYFYVREVEVTGLQNLTAEEVRAAASLSPGVNYWSIDDTQLTRRLLQHPRISEATMQRVFPNRVVIRITERSPVGLVPYDQGFLEVDSSGTALAFHVTAPAHEQLPFFTGIGLDVAGEGGELPGQVLSGEGLLAALNVADLLGPGGRAQLSEVHCEAGELELFTASGIPVLIGQPAELEAKLEILLGILADIQESQLDVEYIDIRVPHQPVVRMRKSE